LPTVFDAEQQVVQCRPCREPAAQFDAGLHIEMRHVLHVARTRHVSVVARFRDVALRDVGIVERAVQIQHAQRVPDLPVAAERVGEDRAPVHVRVADGVLARRAEKRRPRRGRLRERDRPAGRVDLGDRRGQTAIGHARVGVVFELQQPASPRVLPFDRRRDVLACAVDVVAEAACMFTPGVEPHAPCAGQHPVEIDRCAETSVTACCGRDISEVLRQRLLGDPVDDAAAAAAPVQRCGRPLQHFDALDVAEAAHVLRIVAHPVEQQVACAGKTANAERIEACIGRVRHARHAGQRIGKRAAAVGQRFVDRDAVDGLRYVTRVAGGAGRRAHAVGTRIVRVAAAAHVDRGQFVVELGRREGGRRNARNRAQRKGQQRKTPSGYLPF
jgi:hypothetical protein